MKLGGSGTRDVKIQGCQFHGYESGNVALAIDWAQRVEVTSSNFRNASIAIFVESEAEVEQFHASHNDFSQGGASIDFNSTPEEVTTSDNFGSKGYLSRSGGVASIKNGDTVSHGLGEASAPIAPEKYGAVPGNAKRICAVTNASSSTLTISLHDDSGAAITEAENVSWWAER